MYIKVKMLSWGYQLVLVATRKLRGAVICVLCKQSELGIGQGSYAVVLLVSPLVLLTIGKFISLNEHCFVTALFFSFVHILLLNIYSV